MTRATWANIGGMPASSTLIWNEIVEDVFWFNCMGTDGKPGTSFADAGGRFRLDRDKVRLEYKQGSRPTDHPVFAITESIMKAMATKMQGEYVPFPLGRRPFW
jgi:hypothetical protein